MTKIVPWTRKARMTERWRSSRSSSYLRAPWWTRSDTLSSIGCRGTRADAMQFATKVAARERGISEEQAREAIRRRSGGRWSGQH